MFDPITGEGEEESMAEPCVCGHRHDEHEPTCTVGWEMLSETAADGWSIEFTHVPGLDACYCPRFARPVTEHPMSDCPWEAA